MQISSSAYMGVETLVRLAAQDGTKPCTTRCLADWINRSELYTQRLMEQLHDAGLVIGRHGPDGGYCLARPAEHITVAEVCQAVAEPVDLWIRPLNATTFEAEDVHNLHGTDLLWQSLKSSVLHVLNGVSLADLALEAADLIGGNDYRATPIYQTDMQSTARH